MREYKKYWWALVAVVTIAFGILGYYGVEVYREAPPVVSFADKNGKTAIKAERDKVSEFKNRLAAVGV